MHCPYTISKLFINLELKTMRMPYLVNLTTLLDKMTIEGSSLYQVISLSKPYIYYHSMERSWLLKNDMQPILHK
jgi:hypothetical protein